VGQGQQNAQPRRQLCRQEAHGLRVCQLSAGQGAGFGPRHALIKVGVPHVIDGASGAPHDERTRGKERKEPGIGETPRRRRQGRRPAARPQEQHGADGLIQPGQSRVGLEGPGKRIDERRWWVVALGGVVGGWRGR